MPTSAVCGVMGLAWVPREAQHGHELGNWEPGRWGRPLAGGRGGHSGVVETAGYMSTHWNRVELPAGAGTPHLIRLLLR